MPVVKNGAELVRLLKESGTKDNRLAPARECLKRVKAQSGKIASSEQVIAALETAYGSTHMTVVKAQALAKTGEWKKATAAVAVAIEDELLGGTSTMSDSDKADAAGNKAANDLEPGSGDSDPVKVAAKEKAEKDAKEAAEKAAAPPVSEATAVPAPAPPAAKPKVQMAKQTREVKGVEKHPKADDKSDKSE